MLHLERPSFSTVLSAIYTANEREGDRERINGEEPFYVDFILRFSCDKSVNKVYFYVHSCGNASIMAVVCFKSVLNISSHCIYVSTSNHRMFIGFHCSSTEQIDQRYFKTFIKTNSYQISIAHVTKDDLIVYSIVN